MSSEEVKPEEISSSEISTSIQESVIEPITDGIVLKSCRKVYSGEYVVLRINEGLKYIVIRASENGSFKVNKKINLKQSQLIGCYIGAFYEVIGGVLKQTEEQKSLVDMVGEGVEEIRETKDPNEVDNRHLVQNTQSQKLSAEEIVQMKDKGISSAELLKKIAENSETFQAKTAFSQEKYLRRKQKKHGCIFKVMAADPRSLTEAYFTKLPASICNLRWDSLAQLMASANISAGATVLVAETCRGIVTGAIVERLGGTGRVINVFFGGQSPMTENLAPFNFSTLQLSTVLGAKFDSLAENPDEPLCPQVQQALSAGVHALVIVTKYEPQLILGRLFRHLSNSGTLVMFCSSMQPLVECQQELHSRGLLGELELHETWTREYQVLPSRTHPTMMTHGASGYLLTGTKVESFDETKQDHTIKICDGGDADAGDEPPKKRQRKR